MNVRLIRYHEGLKATLGILKFPAVHQPIYTMELPWRENAANISCIPVGVYKVVPHNSINHPHTFEVINVPNRSAILIHTGNYPTDFEGCIGVGMGVSPSTPMISSSNVAMDMVRNLGDGGFTLSVENA